MRRERLILAGVVLVALAAPASSTGCGGTAVLSGEDWVLNCSGSCPAGPPGSQPNQCRGVTKTDSPGDYKVCECTVTGGEPACCHTVIRDGMPEGKGTCNASPPTSCTGGPDCRDGNSDDEIADFLCQDP